VQLVGAREEPRCCGHREYLSRARRRGSNTGRGRKLAGTVVAEQSDNINAGKRGSRVRVLGQQPFFSGPIATSFGRGWPPNSHALTGDM
jgi:hypothetical protein